MVAVAALETMLAPIPLPPAMSHTVSLAVGSTIGPYVLEFIMPDLVSVSALALGRSLRNN